MIETRPERPDDEAFLRRLFESTREDDFAVLPEPQRTMLLDMQFRAQRGQYAASYPQASFAIVERDGAPIGNLTVDRSGPDIHLIDIGLLPEARGKGIGAELLQGLLEEAASAGKAVTLQVSTTNPAQILYRRLGFQETESDVMYTRMEWRAEP